MPIIPLYLQITLMKNMKVIVHEKVKLEVSEAVLEVDATQVVVIILCHVWMWYHSSSSQLIVNVTKAQDVIDISNYSDDVDLQLTCYIDGEGKVGSW